MMGATKIWGKKKSSLKGGSPQKDPLNVEETGNGGKSGKRGTHL